MFCLKAVLFCSVFPFTPPSLIMKDYAKEFYKSKRWQDCRNSYMKSVGGLCEDCLKKGKIVPAEEVHHVVWLNETNIHDPNVTLNWKNLVALCRECHRARHGARQTRYTIDEYGRVTPREIPH